MLFTKVDAETKYKAKNAIDTFVYRGGDVISAWANYGIVASGTSALAAVAGLFVAGAWAGVGWVLGRRHDSTSREHDEARASAGPSGAARSAATGS
jgi:AAA family ATP:ADP antiporter